MEEKCVIILQTPSGYGALLGKSKGKEMSHLVVECTAGKSTQTLQLRVLSWMVLKWAMDNGHGPYPFKLGVVEDFLRHAVGGAATGGSRFLEAVTWRLLSR